MSADLPTEIRVWCHMCETLGPANLNLSSCEYECVECGSDCVEKDNQGIEEFRENSQASTQSEAQEANELVQHVMDRILGISSVPMGSYHGGALPGQLPLPASAMRRLPVIDNPLSGDMSAMGFLSVPGNVGVPMAHQSAFGLLSSLNSMRSIPGMFSTSAGSFEVDPSNSDVASRQWEDFLHHILMNESSRAGAPPAPKQLLEGLSRHTIADESEVSSYGECCITQDPFEIGEKMIPLPCGHNYKQEPILHWLEMHNTCPVCRVEVKQ